MSYEVKIPVMEVESWGNRMINKTTKVYTHVDKANIARIRDPIDTIFEKGRI